MCRFSIDKSMNQTRGFTLIEIIIVIGIVLLLSGGGAVVMNAFNQRQQVTTTATNIVGSLSEAKANALAGKKSAASCSGKTLDGWRVNITSGLGGGVTVTGVCGGIPFDSQTQVFPVGVTTVGVSQVIYKPLGLGATVTGGPTLIVTGRSPSVTLNISADGGVSQ